MNDGHSPEFPFDAPPAGAFDAIFHALDAASAERIGPAEPRPLVIPLRDDAGAVAGGLWGCTLFRWLHVQMLFVPERLRGKGVGSALMRSAETEARERGCIGAHLSSFSFQATPFYQKLGFAKFGQLDDFPPGHALVFLRKRFGAIPDDGAAAVRDAAAETTSGAAGDHTIAEDSAGPATPAGVLDDPANLADTAGELACADDQALSRARELACAGQDEAAKQAYIDVLRRDPTNFSALNELGALASASGHRSAARTAHAQSVRCHPDNAVGRINLGNLLFEEGDLSAARAQYETVLAAMPEFPPAHQGMARVLSELGETEAADSHRHKGFTGHAITTRRYRGLGRAVPVLRLVSSRGGNIPTRHWIDDRHFAVTTIHADFFDPSWSPPPGFAVLNAIGDADLCAEALTGAENLLEKCPAPPINPPALVRATARAANASRLGRIPGVIAPKIVTLPRQTPERAAEVGFPLLLRSPGFHTGRNFVRVSDRAALARAAEALPGPELLAIQYLDARGPDGMARKYRVMSIGGMLYPLHLAIAADWKVHYFTAAMATSAAYRKEERGFLDDMPGVLGPRAMAALETIGRTLGLGYAGIDFARADDGSVLLFEANATMAIVPPAPDPMWDYRRAATGRALAAARALLPASLMDW